MTKTHSRSAHTLAQDERTHTCSPTHAMLNSLLIKLDFGFLPIELVRIRTALFAIIYLIYHG